MFEMFLLKIILIIFLFLLTIKADNCPGKCTCKQNVQRDGREWIKVKCGETEKVNYFEELDLFNLANDIVQLNLSSNNLGTFEPKIHLPALQKLDLSKNQLSILYDNQFIEVPNLRRLDLSGNKIKHIELSAFNNLNFLEKLKLDNNQISTIRKEAFKPLMILKQLDISENPLTCDCELLWLLDWTTKLPLKLLSNPKCNSPFKGKALRKLKIGVDIHCKSPAGSREVPLIELNPSNGQIIFEGDSLKLICTALTVASPEESQLSDNITWSWNNKFDHEISIDNRYLIEQGIISSTLIIRKANQNHTGNFSCQLLTTDGGYHSKNISILVISKKTKYCPITTTNNNKGSYVWPQTVVNNTVTSSCESLRLNNDISAQKVTYTCSETGMWVNLDTSKCGYISETTKILEQFSKVNLTLTKSTLLESARHFKNYTSNLNILKDIMDLIFVIQTIENYLNYLEYESELGAILLDITNNLLNLPDNFINKIDVSQLTRVITKIASYTPSSLLHKDNIALEEFFVNDEVFNGMTCTWYVDAINLNDRLFQCINANQSTLAGIQNRLIETSIQIPSNIFYNANEDQLNFQKHLHKLIVIMYSNSKFFPVKLENKEIVSAVVGVQLVDYPSINLIDPIYVLLKSPQISSYEMALPVPVWWDIQLNNGTGGWSTDGCRISHNIEENLVIKCNRIGYYGLLQNMRIAKDLKEGAKFRLSHSAIYVGSAVLMLCLLLSVLTYLFSYNAIQMPKKTKHSLINTWIALIFLCFVFVFGIYQTEDVQLCQIIGLILHYFTLSSLLWMCVCVNCMYKRLRKNDTIQLQDDELPSEEPIQKPILGLYLVGWGIALIICGISGAINMKEYASYTHCFLNSGPALSAVFIPFAILIIFLSIHFLLIRCYVYNVDTNGHLSEGTQATENVDLDLLEPNFPHVEESRSVPSISSKSSSEIEDPEHSPITQLKAHIIFLVIYVLMWFSCAFATTKPIRTIPHEEDVFSFTYAILSSTLGIFTLFFYCIARSDVRKEWLLLTKNFRRKRTCFRSRNVSDTNQAVSLGIPTRTPVETQIVSRSSSRSSSRTKSHQSNVLKSAADLNTSTLPDGTSSKINNVNLLVLHRQQYIIPNIIENRTNTAEMFYNPHQSTVARKFFKRQKRNTMKHNNLPRNTGSDNNSNASTPKLSKDNGSIDRNIFGTNSKVNNTNIHVEKVRRNKQRNPNIFDDSYDDLTSVDHIPIEKLIKSAERIKKKEQGKFKKRKENVSNESPSHDNNMRSVSQQCTLEYSSETLSDSILNSPDKLSSDVRLRRENSPMDLLVTSGIEEKVVADTYCAPILDVREKHDDISPNNQPRVKLRNQKIPRIYVNPCHELSFINKRVQSRASSVSTSELDELYQQIRRGPKSKYSRSQTFINNERYGDINPYYSDTEVNSYINNSKLIKKNLSCEDNETTV